MNHSPKKLSLLIGIPSRILLGGVLLFFLFNLWHSNAVSVTQTKSPPSANASQQSPVRRALLVGINTYSPATGEKQLDAAQTKRGKNRGVWGNLEGPVNDVDGMHEILIARFGFKRGNIRVLKNAEATRDNILAAIRRHLIEEAAAGDVGLFFYAGHGSQVRNSKSTEADKFDESYVPADASKNASDIRDKELARLFNRSLDKGVLLTAILDSCHSGSGVRGGYPTAETVRALDPNLEDVADPPDTNKAPEERGALVFSAASDDQKALELPDESGEQRGLFSAALLKTLQTVSVNESAERIYLRVKSLMQSSGKMQEPILACTEERRRRSLFGLESENVSGSTTVAVLKLVGNGEVELQGGKAVGLVERCELKKSEVNPMAPVRLQVTETLGLNRCRAKILPGKAIAVKVGDLFEVDRWFAPEEALISVWMPPATLSQADLLRTAKELSSLGSSDKVIWIDDPTEMSAEQKPLSVIGWDGIEWFLQLERGRRKKLGPKPTAPMILASFPAKTKPALFLHLPPTTELSKQLKLGKDTVNDAVKVVGLQSQANYLLAGRYKDGKLEYAWMLPGVTKEQGSELPLPNRTDWFPAQTLDIAAQLDDGILRAGKVKAWLQIEAPPERNPFPYHLVIKNRKTGEIRRAGKIIENEEYDLDLIANPNRPAGRPITPRYLYVFSINSKGKSKLCYPESLAEKGEVEHKHPIGPEEQEKINLWSFGVGDPFGIDSFILITSVEAIPGVAAALNFEGVRTRGQVGEQHPNPLTRLLYQTGSATRAGYTFIPSDWSIQRISLQSVPQSEK
ncbi:MAG: caspase family protein [Acidobacteria bacterium]|nr:caspase family protein [Acidobacteriota bacterium]